MLCPLPPWQLCPSPKLLLLVGNEVPGGSGPTALRFPDQEERSGSLLQSDISQGEGLWLAQAGSHVGKAFLSQCPWYLSKQAVLGTLSHAPPTDKNEGARQRVLSWPAWLPHSKWHSPDLPPHLHLKALPVNNSHFSHKTRLALRMRSALCTRPHRAQSQVLSPAECPPLHVSLSVNVLPTIRTFP